MLKEHSSILRKLNIVFDACLIIGSFYFAYRLRQAHLFSETTAYAWIVVPFLLVFVYQMYRRGLYNQLRLVSTLKLVQEVFVSFLITFALISAILYLTHSGYYSRLLFGYFSVIVFLLILVEKLAVKYFQFMVRKKWYNFRPILLVGDGKKID